MGPKKAEEEDSGSEIARAVGTVVGIAAAVGTAAYGLASLFGSRSEEPAETSRKAHGNLSAPNKWWSQESLGVGSSQGLISAGGSATPGGVGCGAPSATDWIGWQPPVYPWYKLNTDGTSQDLLHCSGAGGLIRDHNGEYRVGFNVKLNCCTSSQAEWWGAYHGLSLAWERGFKRIILEIDNQGVACEINKIIEKNDFNLNAHRADTPKDKIRRLLGNDWEVKVIHLQRKVNKCADRLAEMAVKKNVMEQLSVMEQPPDDPHFLDFLSQDRNGVLRRE